MTEGEKGSQLSAEYKSCRGVNIKTGVGGQAQVTVNALKILAVIVCKEKSVRAEGFMRLIHAPEETDHGRRMTSWLHSIK